MGQVSFAKLVSRGYVKCDGASFKLTWQPALNLESSTAAGFFMRMWESADGAYEAKSTLNGGLFLMGAKMGQVELDGAYLQGDEYAIAGGGLTLSDSLYLRAFKSRHASKPPMQTQIEGQVDLSNARIGGMLNCAGLQLRGGVEETVYNEQDMSFYAPSLDVSGDVLFGPRFGKSRGKSLRCAIEGGVNLVNAQIGGSTRFDGAALSARVSRERAETAGTSTGSVALTIEKGNLQGNLFLCRHKETREACVIYGAVKLSNGRIEERKSCRRSRGRGVTPHELPCGATHRRSSGSCRSSFIHSISAYCCLV